MKEVSRRTLKKFKKNVENFQEERPVKNFIACC